MFDSILLEQNYTEFCQKIFLTVTLMCNRP